MWTRATTLTWSLESDDANDFSITKNTDGDGELRFKTAPNFEMPTDGGSIKNTYLLTVKVTDSGDLSDTSAIVNVRVTNVNEAPTIDTTTTTASVNENSTAVLTLAASDVDDGTTLTWSVEPADDGGKFDINSTTGALTFKSAPDYETPTDVGGDNTYVVTVKVQDNGVTGDTARKSDTHQVTVTVTNVNEAPVITTDSATFTDFIVDENTNTTTIIKTYEATDVDASTTLTWSLEGTDASDFTIDSTTGELRFDSVPNYEMADDADQMNDYEITVKVKDNGIPGNRGTSNQLDHTVNVMVEVEDVNEAPVVSGDTAPSFAEIEFDIVDADLSNADLTEIPGEYTASLTRTLATTFTWAL